MLNIDDRLIKDVTPKIGANALAVLLAISVHLNKKTNLAFPSHSRLMSITGLGRDAVYKALGKLKDAGLLTVEQEMEGRGKIGRRTFRVDTDLISVFIPAKEISLTENTDTINTYTINTDAINQEHNILRSNKRLNKDKQINNNGTPAAETSLQRLERWIAELNTGDEKRLLLEAFQLTYKLPAARFEECFAAFKAKASTTAEKYFKRADVVEHFLNFSARHCEKNPARAASAKYFSAENRAY